MQMNWTATSQNKELSPRKKPWRGKFCREGLVLHIRVESNRFYDIFYEKSLSKSSILKSKIQINYSWQMG